MLEGGGNNVAPTRTTAPTSSTINPDTTTAAQPYEGAYQADQAAAERAFNDAQAQLEAQKQSIYNDYGIGADGQYNGDIYSQYGQMEHGFNDQSSQLALQDQQFQRDSGLATSDNQHQYDSLLSGLNTSQGRQQEDASTQEGRLARDYGLQTAGLDRQQANLTRDYGLQREDTLGSYADQLDAARSNGLARGFNGGIGEHPSQRLAAALSRGLGRQDTAYNDSLGSLKDARTNADNSYGDSTSDVRTQLARAMQDIGTQRDSGKYDFTQRATQLANSLADESAGYKHDTGELDYSHGLNKSNLSSGWAQALAQNTANQIAANQTFSQAKIDARTKYATQAATNNDTSLKALLAQFGL